MVVVAVVEGDENASAVLFGDDNSIIWRTTTKTTRGNESINLDIMVENSLEKNSAGFVYAVQWMMIMIAQPKSTFDQVRGY